MHKYTTEYDSRLPPVKMEVHSTVLHPSRNKPSLQDWMLLDLALCVKRFGIVSGFFKTW